MLIVPIHYLQIVASNCILMPQQQNWPGLTIHQSVVRSQLNLPRGGRGVGKKEGGCIGRGENGAIVL